MWQGVLSLVQRYQAAAVSKTSWQGHPYIICKGSQKHWRQAARYHRWPAYPKQGVATYIPLNIQIRPEDIQEGLCGSTKSNQDRSEANDQPSKWLSRRPTCEQKENQGQETVDDQQGKVRGQGWTHQVASGKVQKREHQTWKPNQGQQVERG